MDIADPFSYVDILLIDSTVAHMTCIEPDLDQHFYSSLIPTKPYLQTAKSIYGELQSHSFFKTRPVVALHIRNFEGACLHRANTLFAPTSTASVSRMCNLSPELIQEILEAHGFAFKRSVAVYVASDGQRRDLVDSLKRSSRKDGVEYYDAEDKRTNDLFAPAVDMIVMAMSMVFIGNSLSTLSTHVGNWRASASSQFYGWTVLSWPRLERDWTAEAYWECHHTSYWCADSGSLPLC